jgi:hypothetical protein
MLLSSLHIDIMTQQSRSPSSRKTTFSSKTHKNGRVDRSRVYKINAKNYIFIT